MSEHGAVMEPGEFDLVGFAVGVVERSRVLPAGVRPGDAIIGFASGGLRCNGYSLARRALLDVDGRDLDGPAWAGAHKSLADELLRPSVIYAPSMLDLRRHVDVHAFAHVTGGGIVGNLARVLPDEADAVVWRDAWERPSVFGEVQAAGNIADAEMEHVFNLGLGMLAVVPGDAVRSALEAVRAAGHEAWVVGEVTGGRGRAMFG
jgi:phosphoribosylformylglycinamidine cyclo-ligase